jgi:hypothetical protein
MERLRMKTDRRWLILLTLILAASFLYFSFPLVVEGVHSLIAILILGGAILWALPQILWWILGAAFLVLWGLGVIVHLAGRELAGKKKTKADRPFSGRLRGIHRTLLRGASGRYFQDEVRNLLRARAVDLIALKLDISEEEAQKRFQEGDWTEDPLLQMYFSEEKSWGKEKRSPWPWFKISRPPAFLEKARTALERLEIYGNFPHRKGKYDPSHFDP